MAVDGVDKGDAEERVGEGGGDSSEEEESAENIMV